MVQLEAEFARTRSLATAKEIARLEAEFARLSGKAGPFAADAVVERGDEADLPADGLEHQTYAARIEQALARSSVPITAQAICAAIGEPSALATVRAILSKLVTSERVERVSTGLYKLAHAGHRDGAADDD
jgi:hypothetical protein